MEALTLEPESVQRVGYDDPSKYNHYLYRGAEHFVGSSQLLDDWVQQSARFGAMALGGVEMLGVPSMFTEGLRVRVGALAVMSERNSRAYGKPEFGLDKTLIDGKEIAVSEEVIDGQDHPFGPLLHFTRETDRYDPPTLVVAPVSGHFPTLVRDTVRQLLPHHDPYTINWPNVRDVPLEEGEFGLNTYIDSLIGFIKEIGPD